MRKNCLHCQDRGLIQRDVEHLKKTVADRRQLRLRPLRRSVPIAGRNTNERVVRQDVNH